jgi:hypothetical protein
VWINGKKKLTLKKKKKLPSTSMAIKPNSRKSVKRGSQTNLFSNLISGKIKADFTHTRYKVIKECAAEVGWKSLTFPENTTKKDDLSKMSSQICDLYWHD